MNFDSPRRMTTSRVRRRMYYVAKLLLSDSSLQTHMTSVEKKITLFQKHKRYHTPQYQTTVPFCSCFLDIKQHNQEHLIFNQECLIFNQKRLLFVTALKAPNQERFRSIMEKIRSISNAPNQEHFNYGSLLQYLFFQVDYQYHTPQQYYQTTTTTTSSK